MKNLEIKKIWENFIKDYNKYFKSNEEIWKDNLLEIKNYIKEFGRLPFNHKWLSHQKENYKDKKNIMKIRQIKKLWEEFVQEYKEYFKCNEETWIQKLNELKKFLDTNKKLPSAMSHRSLRDWTERQKRIYEYNDEIMKNHKINALWKDFIEEYSQYFQSKEIIYKQNIEKLKKYIDTNKQLPLYKDKDGTLSLRSWMNTQNYNYEKQIKNMKNTEIKELWKEFTNEYSHYFRNDENIWIQNLNSLKCYIDKNHNFPSSKDNNIAIQALYNFKSSQIQLYKMDKMNGKRKILWEEFVQEYKEYFKCNEEIWIQKLNELKKFLDTNKNLPSTSDKTLRNWLYAQSSNYRNEKMNTERKQLFEQLMDEFPEIFKPTKRQRTE
jgi:hypothetical protein